MRTVQDRERTRRPTVTTLQRLTQIVATLLCGLLLTGCLLTLNHPRRTADGTLVVFLDEDGAYTPFSLEGVLHLVRDGKRVPIPAARQADPVAVLDLSPDEGEALYIAHLETTGSALYRVALHPEAVPQAVLETTDLISRAFWVDENSILLMRLDDEGVGTLEMLDMLTGRLEPLAGNLLSFAWLPAENACVLLEADLEGSVMRGSVIKWVPATGLRETLVSFVHRRLTPYSYSFLCESDFLWDVSPDGSWVALCLYDANLLDPLADARALSLYLIDVAQGTASRIAVDALMPSFSPDGTSLVYLAEDPWDERSVAMWRDLRSRETIPVPGSEGAETVFWLSPTTVGLTFEEENRYLLIEIDPATGMRQILLD